MMLIAVVAFAAGCAAQSRRYYTAEVAFAVARPGEKRSGEAAVLVWDAASFAAIRGHTCDAAVKVGCCVGPATEAMEDWALENEIELVEVDLDAWPTERNEFRELTGLPRVKEVLEAHQWPGLVLLDRAETAATADGAAEVVVVDAVGCGEQLVAKLTGGGLRWHVRTKSARGTREGRTAEVSAGAS